MSRSAKTGEEVDVATSNSPGFLLAVYNSSMGEPFIESDVIPTDRIFGTDTQRVDNGNFEDKQGVYRFDGRGPQFITSDGQEDEVEPNEAARHACYSLNSFTESCTYVG